jgi:hypothetical protein
LRISEEKLVYGGQARNKKIENSPASMALPMSGGCRALIDRHLPAAPLEILPCSILTRKF